MEKLQEFMQGMIDKYAQLDPDQVGELSDGYHTFNELYEHRIELYLALVRIIAKQDPEKCWLSLKHSDGTEIKGSFILGINTLTGYQITYHIPEKYLGRVTTNPDITILEKAPVWDQHSPAAVVERLKTLNI